MSDRIATIVVLAEDQEHQNLVRRYLLRSGHAGRSFFFISLPGNKGCGSQYVREQFSKQVAESRQILGRRVKCWLIVITDADNLTAAEREQTLHRELAQSGQNAIDAAEPIVLLIPKWQVETWIKCLLGQSVQEDDKNTDRPPATADQIKVAAETLFRWARPNAPEAASCVESLKAALPRWRRLG